MGHNNGSEKFSIRKTKVAVGSVVISSLLTLQAMNPQEILAEENNSNNDFEQISSYTISAIQSREDILSGDTIDIMPTFNLREFQLSKNAYIKYSVYSDSKEDTTYSNWELTIPEGMENITSGTITDNNGHTIGSYKTQNVRDDLTTIILPFRYRTNKQITNDHTLTFVTELFDNGKLLGTSTNKVKVEAQEYSLPKISIKENGLGFKQETVISGNRNYRGEISNRSITEYSLDYGDFNPYYGLRYGYTYLLRYDKENFRLLNSQDDTGTYELLQERNGEFDLERNISLMYIGDSKKIPDTHLTVELVKKENDGSYTKVSEEKSEISHHNIWKDTDSIYSGKFIVNNSIEAETEKSMISDYDNQVNSLTPSTLGYITPVTEENSLRLEQKTSISTNEEYQIPLYNAEMKIAKSKDDTTKLDLNTFNFFYEGNYNLDNVSARLYYKTNQDDEKHYISSSYDIKNWDLNRYIEEVPSDATYLGFDFDNLFITKGETLSLSLVSTKEAGTFKIEDITTSYSPSVQKAKVDLKEADNKTFSYTTTINDDLETIHYSGLSGYIKPVSYANRLTQIQNIVGEQKATSLVGETVVISSRAFNSSGKVNTNDPNLKLFFAVPKGTKVDLNSITPYGVQRKSISLSFINKETKDNNDIYFFDVSSTSSDPYVFLSSLQANLEVVVSDNGELQDFTSGITIPNEKTFSATRSLNMDPLDIDKDNVYKDNGYLDDGTNISGEVISLSATSTLSVTLPKVEKKATLTVLYVDGDNKLIKSETINAVVGDKINISNLYNNLDKTKYYYSEELNGHLPKEFEVKQANEDIAIYFGNIYTREVENTISTNYLLDNSTNKVKSSSVQISVPVAKEKYTLINGKEILLDRKEIFTYPEQIVIKKNNTYFRLLKDKTQIVKEDGKPIIVNLFYERLNLKTTSKATYTNFKIEYKENSEVKAGTRTVLQNGQKGKVVTYTDYSINEETGEITSTNRSETITNVENKIIEVGTKSTVREKRVRFKTTYQANPDIKAGSRKVIQEGEYGKEITTYSYSVDKETGKLIKTPSVENILGKDRIIEVGTKSDIKNSDYTNFKTIYKENPEVKAGTRTVLQNGQKGKTINYNTYSIDENGRLIKSTKTEIVEPTDRVIEVGTKTTIIEKAIKFSTEYVKNPSISKRTIKVQGKNGKLITTTTFTIDELGKLQRKVSAETIPPVYRVIEIP